MSHSYSSHASPVPGGVDVVEAEKRWGEVAVTIRIVRNAASMHIANRLREVYREYLEKYAQAVHQVTAQDFVPLLTAFHTVRWLVFEV